MQDEAHTGLELTATLQPQKYPYMGLRLDPVGQVLSWHAQSPGFHTCNPSPEEKKGESVLERSLLHGKVKGSLLHVILFF